MVEDPVLTGLEIQMVTELLEGFERALTGGGLGKAVKHYVGRVHPLPCGGEASRIPHGPHGPATLSGASGQAPAPGSSTTLRSGEVFISPSQASSFCQGERGKAQ